MAIQFPNSPGIGSVFTDTDAGFSYEWTGVVWKSFTPAAANNIRELDDLSSGFNNSTTTFNLTIGGEAYQPRNAAMLQISLGGVIQEPSTDYTIDGSTITFTTAPNSGLDFFGVVRGTAVAIDYANDGNVQTKQEFTATEGQTSFTITGGYTAGYIDVFRNGVRLAADDITISSGTAVVLATPAQAGDIIETVKYKVASLVVSQGQFNNLNISGVTTVGVVTGGTSVSASHFYGDGSALTGIDATAISDSGGNVKAQANAHGVAVTGILTGSNANLTGIVTATTFVGNLTGNVTGNTSGTAGGLTGSPNITVGSVAASSGSFTGNVSIGGTLTYQDVSHIDAVGIITAQKGIQVLANGLDITGFSTFKTGVTVTGVATATGYKVGAAISISDGAVSATRFHGSGANLTGLPAGGVEILSSDSSVATSVTAINFSGATLTGGSGFSTVTISAAGVNTTQVTGTGNQTIFLTLSTKQHHTITLAAGITTIDCTGGSVGDSHSVVLINPSSVGTGVTVGFATDFLFPSGSTPSLPTGANDISMISFVVKQTGAGGTEVLASAGLNYSN